MKYPVVFALAWIGILANGNVVHAEAVTLPQTLNGGGSGGSTWIVSNAVGTTNGLPVGGTVGGIPGFGINDGSLGTRAEGDVFDNGVLLFVNNTQFLAPATVERVGQIITAGPVAMSGVNVTIQYSALSDSATLRTLIQFSNPGSDSITLALALATNHGADELAFVAGSSNGDTLMGLDDRWIVTGDSSGYDPAIIHVLFGPGAAVGPTSISGTVFNNSRTEGILLTFDLTVPGLSSRSLLFFNQLHSTTAEALAGASNFDSTPAAGNSLLSGLDAAALAEVANWNFPQVEPQSPTIPVPSPDATHAPEPATLFLFGFAVAGFVFMRGCWKRQRISVSESRR